MSIEYFNHITLTTGNAIRIYPEQIDKDMCLRVQSIVKDAVSLKGIEVFPNIRLELTRMERAYIGTFYLIDDNCPVLSTAGSLDDNINLWEAMHTQNTTHIKTSSYNSIPVPYIIDRIEIPNPKAISFMTVSAKWCQHLAWVLLAPDKVAAITGKPANTEKETFIPQHGHAPIKFLKYLNRLWPNAWRELRTGISQFRPTQSIPNWCVMPVFFPMIAYAQTHDLLRLRANRSWIICMASMYLWRMSKGIYRFTSEIYNALIHQPLQGDIRNDLFYHLPEWAVYIETPGMAFEGEQMCGFIAHLDYNLDSRSTDLQFLIFYPDRIQPCPIALPLGEGTIEDAIARMNEYDAQKISSNKKVIIKASPGQVKKDFSAMVQLVIYLCCDNRDLPPIRHPRERMRPSGAVDSPKEPKIWDVGERIANIIRQFDSESCSTARHTGGIHASPRPHIRRAHYHTFLTGPKDGERGRVVHWIPPLPIGVKWDDDKQMPVVIHPVDS